MQKKSCKKKAYGVYAFFACSISKFKQKKAEMQKKRQKCKKIAEMPKKAENVCSISKLMQKQTKFKNKKAKIEPQFENSCKKRAKTYQKRQFFCTFNPKIHAKKD